MKKQKIGPNQEEWLKALESGKYGQCIGALVKPNAKGINEHCCLGVACEVYGLDKRGDKKSGILGYYSPTNGDTEFGTAPSEIVEFLRLHDEEGEAAGPSSEEWINPFASLVDMNDSSELTFADIAKTIRENPAVYFSEPA